MASDRNAIVIGAGIGGLAAGIALKRIGVDVQVFERADELHEVGAGISLWANAIHALGKLGLSDAIRSASRSDSALKCRATYKARLSVVRSAQL